MINPTNEREMREWTRSVLKKGIVFFSIGLFLSLLFYFLNERAIITLDKDRLDQVITK